MAITPYPFVAGAVLTASQLNSTFNVPVSTKTTSYVLTAADAGTRVRMTAAGATTITVNTSLFSAGDNLRIENGPTGGVCTVTAGTATVVSAGPLAIPVNGGGQLFFTSASAATWFPDAVTATPGLVYLTGASFSAASSISLPTNTFTSTYTNYKVVFRVTAASGTFQLTTRFRAAGADNTTSNYSTASLGVFSNGTANNSLAYNASSISLDAATNTPGLTVNADVNNPQATDTTQIIGALIGFNPLPAISGQAINAQFGATTSFDSMSFIAATSTITGYYKVYGYSNS